MASSVFVFVASLVVLANSAKVPSNWKVCKRSLPPEEYDPCIKDAVESAVRDLLATGAPSLKIAPMEPLKFETINIGQGGSGPVSIDLKLKDVEISNLPSAEFSNIRHKDAENLKVGIDVKLKKPLVVKAKYELSGKVLVFPINGKGDSNYQFDNFRASFNMSGVPFKKGKETYANVTNFDISFDTDKVHMHFDNLMDGNKELGDNMNLFLNENWKILLDELRPAIIEALSLACKAVANQIFRQVPVYKLMPE